MTLSRGIREALQKQSTGVPCEAAKDESSNREAAVRAESALTNDLYASILSFL